MDKTSPILTPHTSISPEDAVEKSPDETSSDSFLIRVEQQDILYQDSHKNLLECLEDSSVEVHYHCRDGYCGACRVTLRKGQVKYPQGEPLAYVAPDEILPCCCEPTSNIVINIDN